LAQLRARFGAQPSRWGVDARQRELADDLRRLKRELADTLHGADSCHGCAKGHPQPAGRWQGGHCCGGRTERVFTPDEVMALKLAGTSPGDLRAPTTDHAGCSFRGPAGCSLSPEDRPAICLRYVCLELRAELREQPRWKRIAELSRALDSGFRTLTASVRLDDERLD
jgi:hypothetical protein